MFRGVAPCGIAVIQTAASLLAITAVLTLVTGPGERRSAWMAGFFTSDPRWRIPDGADLRLTSRDVCAIKLSHRPRWRYRASRLGFDTPSTGRR